jgi:hypothetical protein
MDIPLVKHMNRGKNPRQFTKNTISIIVKQKLLGLVYGAINPLLRHPPFYVGLLSLGGIMVVIVW